MSEKAPQEWSFGQWAFLIVACCSISLWRFFSTTQQLPYNVFFWGDVLVTMLAAICLFAFPFAFQDGDFAKDAIGRMRFSVGPGPFILALVHPVVAFCIAVVELGFGNQLLLPFSPIKSDFASQNYPSLASVWLTAWGPRILFAFAMIFATALVISIPKRAKRVKVTVAFYALLNLTSNLGFWFSTKAFGTAIWGPNLSNSPVLMSVLNQALYFASSVFLMLRIEKAFRPSLSYIWISGVLSSTYFTIVRPPTNWNAAGATLISTAVCLILLETKFVQPNVSLEEVERGN